MNKEIKEKWCALLEDPRYIQGTDMLVQEDSLTGEFKYCCLGVLFEAMNIQKRSEQGPSGRFWGYPSHEPGNDQGLERTTLTPEVRDLAGLSHTNPMVVIGGTTKGLMGHNDDGIPFALIAKAIREQL